MQERSNYELLFMVSGIEGQEAQWKQNLYGILNVYLIFIWGKQRMEENL